MIVANQWISEHLRHAEVRCRCRRTGAGSCDGGHLRVEAVLLFERIRRRCSEAFGRDCPIRIASGVRCRVHNLLVGGSDRSAHLSGMALDLKNPPDLDVETFRALCAEEVGEGGLGIYSWGVHVDAVAEPPGRRWSG